MTQLSFNFENSEPISLPRSAKKKRVRYKIPTYKKYYKFTHINPLTGELQYNGDERHIFRIKNLQIIYSLLYSFTCVNPLEEREYIEIGDMVVWIEDMQAEIKGTEMLSIKERIKIHIDLLRLLRKGESLENAVNSVVCQFRKELQYKDKKEVCDGFNP